MNSEVQQILNEANECLQDAAVMLREQRYKAVVSRSYYAMYHTAKAALISQNIEVYTHQGVNMMFAKHFVKTGLFDKSLNRAYSKMLDKRMKSDYEIGFKASHEDASDAYNEATNFYNTISLFLAEGG